MTRSCFALTLLLLVLGVSLYAIRSAQGQTHLDARLGSARQGLCPLLGDEVHRCGFGLTPHPTGNFRAPSVTKVLEPVERLCPLAFCDDAELESQFGMVIATKADAKDFTGVLLGSVTSSSPARMEPPTDPYPLSSLPSPVVSGNVAHARYLSGHDPLYDSAVYGLYPANSGLFEETDFLPVEVAEACRRPLAELFSLEEPRATNYGYLPAQLDQGLGTRGALRTLGQLPRRLYQRAMDSSLAGNVQCELADIAYRSRRQFQSSAWLASFRGQQPPHMVANRPMVTEQVTLAPLPPELEEELIAADSADLASLPKSAPAESHSSGVIVLQAPQRLLVQSLAVSLDQTGRLLQNASRQLQQLIEN